MNGFTSHRTAKHLLVAALLAFVFSRTAHGVVDLDLWHELALVREAISLGYVPWQDHFAFTPKLDLVVHHEWGAGLIAYLAMTLTGSSGVVVLKFVLIFGLASTCWIVARQRGASVLATGLVAGLAIVLADYSFATIRAQMYSYLLTALLLLGFDRDRHGDRRWLIGLLLLFPVWVNLHGGCLVGAGLVGAHWLEQLLRRRSHWHLFAAGAALIPLALLNPWGWHYLVYLARAITMPRPRIGEWAPLWAAGEVHHLLAFVVSVLLAWLILRDGRWRQMPGFLLLVATGLASLKSNRFLAFYAIVYACYLPAELSRIELGKDLRRWWCQYRRMFAASCAVATLLLTAKATSHHPWQLHVPGSRMTHASEPVIYPVGAVNYLARHEFHGNVFVSYDWGSYVMWKLGPDVQISLDSRYEVAYPAWRLEEDFAFLEARDNWQSVLTKYPIDIVLVPRSMPIATKLQDVPGWHAIYRDSQFALFAPDRIQLPNQLSDDTPPDGAFP